MDIAGKKDRSQNALNSVLSSHSDWVAGVLEQTCHTTVSPPTAATFHTTWLQTGHLAGPSREIHQQQPKMLPIKFTLASIGTAPS